MVCLSFFSRSHSSDCFSNVLISLLSDLCSRQPCLDFNEGLPITVRHCLILVTAKEYFWPCAMVSPATLVWAPNHLQGAGWRVLTPVERFLRPNGVATANDVRRTLPTSLDPALEQWRTQHEIIIISCWIKVCFLGLECWHKQILCRGVAQSRNQASLNFRIWYELNTLFWLWD